MTIFNATNVGDKKLEKKLLWTNASPTSAFAAQTISLNLSEYDEIEIEYKQNTSDTYRIINKILKGTARIAMWFTNLTTDTSNVFMYSRNTSVTATGVTFAACARKIIHTMSVNAAANDYLIPTKIWGIKGVQ